MTRRLAGRARRFSALALGTGLTAAIASLAGLPSRVRADDHVTVRGAYFREASTRVVQPVVEISKDAPNGVDINAHYLLDAITSASAAAGAPGDSIFTELRNEVGLAVGKTIDRTRLGLSYRYSAESDYWSHGVVASGSQRFWGDSATVSAYGGVILDAILGVTRARTAHCVPTGETTCSLHTYSGGLSYAQILSPTLLVQLGYDFALLEGFQASIYRSVPGLTYDTLPNERMRHAFAAHVAYYIPRTSTGLQLHYRYYRDDWSIQAHMVEGRLFQQISRDLEVRLSYRQYFQNSAELWCDWMGIPGCYTAKLAAEPPDQQFHTSDPKLGPVRTEMPEVKLVWDAVRLRGVPFFGWFAAGSFDVSYAHYFQSTAFGNAHLLQAGYTMPY